MAVSSNPLHADMFGMALDLPDGWEKERASAFEWLMEDPDHRAIQSPDCCDAVLNMYAARDAYPAAVFTSVQFSSTRYPADVGRTSRELPFHLYIL